MSNPVFHRFALLLLVAATPALGQDAPDDEMAVPQEQTLPLTEDQILYEFDLFQRYLADILVQLASEAETLGAEGKWALVSATADTKKGAAKLAWGEALRESKRL